MKENVVQELSIHSREHPTLNHRLLHLLSTWPSIPFGFSTFAFPGVFEDDEEEVLAVLFFVDVANLLAALLLADAEDNADGLLTARFFADNLVGASFIADVAEDDEPVAFFFDFPIVRETTLLLRPSNQYHTHFICHAEEAERPPPDSLFEWFLWSLA